MSYNHDHGIRKTPSGSSRDKHCSTRTRRSHLKRGPYFQPGIGMGRYKSPYKKSLRKRIGRFFRRLFRKNITVHIRKSPTIRVARANMKPIASMKAVTRIHQRKGER